MPQMKVHKDVSAGKDNFSRILSCQYLQGSTILLNTHILTARQYTIYLLNTKGLQGIFQSANLPFLHLYPNLYMPPSEAGNYHHTHRRCMQEQGNTLPAYTAGLFSRNIRNLL